jgi:hypothetical protein
VVVSSLVAAGAYGHPDPPRNSSWMPKGFSRRRMGPNGRREDLARASRIASFSSMVGSRDVSAGQQTWLI